MEPIKNSRELKIAYEVLEEIQSLKTEKSKEVSCRIKIRIRDYFRERECELKRRCIKNYGDGTAIFLEELPEYIKTEPQAEDWFEYNRYIESPHTAFGCIGRLFTSWFKVICRRGRYYAYHYISCDV